MNHKTQSKQGRYSMFQIHNLKFNINISWKLRVYVSMKDGDFWNHIKNIVYVTLGSKRNAMQSSLKQKFKGMSVVIINL